MGDEKPMSASTGAIKKKKDEKSRRRDQRSWENVIKSVTNMAEAEKLNVIQEKYTDLYNDLRKANSTLQLLEKQCTALHKERDHTQAELTKNILAKAKLESLCRELQKQNKIIKDENITRVKEEEERRREVATSFTEKLNLLTTLMDENKDKSVRLREENMSMTTKLTELYDQFQEREGHLANMNRQLELQKQLSETQIKKLEVEYQSERQVWEQERQMLLKNLEKSDQANVALQENIKTLQDHLGIYKTQYSDFETTMQKSNKVFDAFKEEMAKLQKTNNQLERERNEYRMRWQSCTNSLVQVTEMQQQASVELKKAQRKVQMLEKLSRQLQIERTAYIQQLEENNIKPLTPPAPPASDEPPMPAPLQLPAPGSGALSASAQKRLTKKEKLLVALKSELKTMEDELKKKMMAKEKELAALKRDFKLVVEQRKIAAKQQEVAKANQEQFEKQQSTAETEVEQAADFEPQPSTSQLTEKESTMTVESSMSLLTDVDVDVASSLEGISTVTNEESVKEVQSCPVLKKESKTDQRTSSSSSLDDLINELSLDAIPLYKPEGVTDITVQPETDECVTEAEARTNLLDSAASSSTDTIIKLSPSAPEDPIVSIASTTTATISTVTLSSSEVLEISTDPSTAATLRSVDSGSESPEDIAEAKGDADMTARTIPLREVEGKTELKEA